MSGGATQSRGDQRYALLSERDKRVIQMMTDRTPVASIALLEGMAEDYCRKETRRLAAEHGIDYNPVSADPEALAPGLTDASRRYRANLGSMLHAYRNRRPAPHPLEVACAIGISQSDQTKAENRPNGYDWRLNQTERLAAVTGVDFTEMMITALLDGPTTADKLRLQRVLACLKS